MRSRKIILTVPPYKVMFIHLLLSKIGWSLHKSVFWSNICCKLRLKELLYSILGDHFKINAN